MYLFFTCGPKVDGGEGDEEEDEDRDLLKAFKVNHLPPLPRCFLSLPPAHLQRSTDLPSNVIFSNELQVANFEMREEKEEDKGEGGAAPQAEANADIKKKSVEELLKEVRLGGLSATISTISI